VRPGPHVRFAVVYPAGECQWNTTHGGSAPPPPLRVTPPLPYPSFQAMGQSSMGVCGASPKARSFPSPFPLPPFLPSLNKSFPNYPLPNPILCLGIPCALVKTPKLEHESVCRREVRSCMRASYR
jgi:hypothetical protein